MSRRVSVRMIAIVASAFTMSCTGAGETDAGRAAPIKIGKLQLQLAERDGMCDALASVGQSPATRHSLNIPWPCRFHVDATGRLRTITDADRTYILVESSKPASSNPKDCETHLQSLRVVDSRVEVSQHHDRVASCPPFQWDAFLFKELFD